MPDRKTEKEDPTSMNPKNSPDQVAQSKSLQAARNLTRALCEEPFDFEMQESFETKEEDLSGLKEKLLRTARQCAADLERVESEERKLRLKT
jgi:hypothetical protein